MRNLFNIGLSQPPVTAHVIGSGHVSANFHYKRLSKFTYGSKNLVQPLQTIKKRDWSEKKLGLEKLRYIEPSFSYIIFCGIVNNLFDTNMYF